MKKKQQTAPTEELKEGVEQESQAVIVHEDPHAAQELPAVSTALKRFESDELDPKVMYAIPVKARLAQVHEGFVLEDETLMGLHDKMHEVSIGNYSQGTFVGKGMLSLGKLTDMSVKTKKQQEFVANIELALVAYDIDYECQQLLILIDTSGVR